MSAPRQTALFSLSLGFVLVTSASCTPPLDGKDPRGTDTPLFLVHSALDTDDGRSNYFTLVESLDEARALDYGTSLELPGRARLYAAAGIGFFAIGDAENITITRYELEEDGTLVEGASLSLQAHGVTSMGPQAVHFVSPTKAYYKDADQAQVIVWNPEEMVIERAIPLPDDVVVADHVNFFSQWAGREGEAYFAVGAYTFEYDRVLPGTSLVRLDTETDELTVTSDSRCRGLDQTANVDGTLYFFSDVINGFGHAVYPDDAGQQDCILRVSAGNTSFDEDYVGSIAPALDGRIGTVVSVTDDGEVWAQVIDPETMPTEPGTTYGEWYAAGWKWWHLPLATLTDPVEIDGEAGAYSGFTVATDDGFFVSQTAADYSETTLVDLSSGAAVSGLSFPGFALDIARVR